MINKKKVVGHYVVHPIPLEMFGEKTKALFSMSVMTHPEFQGRGIFTSLATEVYKKAISLGYEMLFGFPNANSASIHFNKLGWENNGKIIEYFKKTQAEDVKKNTCDIVEVKSDDKRIDLIWDENKKKYPIIVPRTSAYLKWRFFSQLEQSSTNNSNSFYKLFIVIKNKLPKAYFILKFFNSEKSHIVDMFGDEDREILHSILNFALEFSKEQKSKYLSFWTGKIQNSEIQKICKDEGFLKGESSSYFGTKNLLSKKNVNQNDWHVTMSDSDIF